ncbi:hypothetical protein [Corallococcus macrosporus]|uniref:hypothetical protein n=1 Tax=Corallococcus macrosporus TaxID=35 RepID=UPI001EFE29AC|nr:hypothetical protein [Corallococcus macrosporus]
MVRRGVDRGRLSLDDVRLYVGLAAELGDDFESHRAHAWRRAWLDDTSVPDSPHALGICTCWVAGVGMVDTTLAKNQEAIQLLVVPQVDALVPTVVRQHASDLHLVEFPGAISQSAFVGADSSTSVLGMPNVVSMKTLLSPGAPAPETGLLSDKDPEEVHVASTAASLQDDDATQEMGSEAWGSIGLSSPSFSFPSSQSSAGSFSERGPRRRSGIFERRGCSQGD